MDDGRLLQIADKLVSGNDSLLAEAERTIHANDYDANEILYSATKLVYTKSQPISKLFYIISILFSLLLLCSLGSKGFFQFFACSFFISYWLALVPVLCFVKYEKRNKGLQFRQLSLELEKRGDLRAVEPLLDAWEPRQATRHVNEDATPAQVEAALGRVLLYFVAQTGLPLDDEQMTRLRAKLDALFVPRRRSSKNNTDFSDACADILVTLIQLLSRSTEAADLSLVARIAARPADLPNRVFVREAARECLDAAKRGHTTGQAANMPSLPLPSLTPGVPAQTPAPLLQQGRKP